jgi:hypothetical protein
MNPFTKDLGIHQGRIAIDPAPEGTHVYELGHALLQDVNLDVGDYHEVSQSLLLESASTALLASIVIVTPPLPIAASWELSGWLNGVKMVRRILRASKRTLVLSDIRISLYNANRGAAVDLIAFRLELV